MLGARAPCARPPRPTVANRRARAPTPAHRSPSPRRDAPQRRPARAARAAARDPSTRMATSTTAAPTTITDARNSKPGSGSSSRARPTGARGDRTKATSTVSTAAGMATTAARAVPSATSCARVIPSARRVGWAADSSRAWRNRAWPNEQERRRRAEPAQEPQRLSLEIDRTLDLRQARARVEDNEVALARRFARPPP